MPGSISDQSIVLNHFAKVIVNSHTYVVIFEYHNRGFLSVVLRLILKEEFIYQAVFKAFHATIP